MTKIAGAGAAAAPGHLSQKDDIRTSRGQAMLQVAIEDIQRLDRIQATTLQSLLQHGDEPGVWQTPRKWKLDGHEARLRVDLRQRVVRFLPEKLRREVRVAGVSDVDVQNQSVVRDIAVPSMVASDLCQALDDGVTALTRYLLLLRMGPVGIPVRRRKGPLDPSTISGHAYTHLPPMVAVGVAGRIQASRGAGADGPTPEGCFRYVDAEAIEAFSPSMKRLVLNEMQRMHMLKAMGLWTDTPTLDAEASEASTTAVAGVEASPNAEKRGKPHLPLPDEYVAEMGTRCLWLVQQLGPNLLKIAEEMRLIWAETADRSAKPTVVAEHRSRRLGAFFKDFSWLNSDGLPLGAPPFDLRLSRIGGRGRKRRKPGPLPSTQSQSEWPPRNFAEIMGLLNNLQLAHVFIVALSIGARKSEVLDLKRSCVQYAVDGLPYANGRTFKLVENYEGMPRDWVLPDVAAEALAQQVRLVSLCESIGGKQRRDAIPFAEPTTYMWAQLAVSPGSNPGAPLLGLSQALAAFAGAIGMDKAPGGQTIRTHRLRKTLARLVALALTQAPKILMSVFGHKSIEMTLYYILTDRDLRAEIEKVARELRVLRSKEVIEKMVADEDSSTSGLSLGSYGGPAALMVRQSIDSHVNRLHRRGEEWGADSAVELAEILTLQGKAWEYVRPGVICTKFPGTEAGPCNKSKGHPEPSRCQTHCSHRLEEAFLREDVDGAIQEAFAAHQRAATPGEELVQALWAGQIRAHIVRFADLREKWMAVPGIRRIVESPEEAMA